MHQPSLAHALSRPLDGLHVTTPAASPAHQSQARTPSQSPAHLPGGVQLHHAAGCPPPASVVVIAPGAGTGINGPVYADLGRDPRFQVDIVGQSRAPYDCYPETWSHGSPPPNLASFAQDVLDMRVVERGDCLVVGSRGGQVVLPLLWQCLGCRAPPVVVINGGCAMNLPTRVCWPEAAVSFLLIGGQDNFAGNLAADEYVADTMGRVPSYNNTTAILYVDEMQHMPQAKLLGAILHHMIRALLLWRSSPGSVPLRELRLVLSALQRDGWSGRLLYTKGAGTWEDISFQPYDVRRMPAPPMAPASPDAAHKGSAVAAPPIELTRGDELVALWKAAAIAAKPGGGAPLRCGEDRFAAAAHAAVARASAGAAMLQLPIAKAGSGESKVLQVPMPRTGRGSVGDPTPISRALGIQRAYASPASSHSHSPCQFFVADASPMRTVRSPMYAARG